jgi:hypothetical protein
VIDREGSSAFRLTPSVELLAERFSDTNVEESKGGGEGEGQDDPSIESEDGRVDSKWEIAWPKLTRWLSTVSHR